MHVSGKLRFDIEVSVTHVVELPWNLHNMLVYELNSLNLVKVRSGIFSKVFS